MQKKLKKTDIILIEGRRWFDKVNGNTYHSATVYVNNEEVARDPFTYGYSDAYIQTGFDLINKLYQTNWQSTRDAREQGYNVRYTVTDGLKRDL